MNMTARACMRSALLILLAGTRVPDAAAAQNDFADGFEGARRVSDRVLDSMRGGFVFDDAKAQMRIYFAIERATFVNEKLVTLTRLQFPRPETASAASSPGAEPAPAPSVASDPGPPAYTAANASPVSVPVASFPQSSAPPPVLTASPAQPGAGPGALSSISIVQNGSGNTFAPPSVLPSGIVTVIQNTLDNQVIRNTTVIDATVQGLALARALSVAASLRDAGVAAIR